VLEIGCVPRRKGRSETAAGSLHLCLAPPAVGGKRTEAEFGVRRDGEEQLVEAERVADVDAQHGERERHVEVTALQPQQR
jgi:hypothetical protein